MLAGFADTMNRFLLSHQDQPASSVLADPGEEGKQFLVLEADKFAKRVIAVDVRFARNKSGAVTNRS